MKPRLYSLLILTALYMAACSESQPPKESTPPVKAELPAPTPSSSSGGEDVKKVLQQVLDLAKAGDCKAMAPLLVLSHTDTPQDWTRAMNYETQSEKVAVDKECAKLQVIVEGMEGIDYKEFSQDNESEGEWNVWVTEVRYADGNSEQRTFAFLRLGNAYLLGDID